MGHIPTSCCGSVSVATDSGHNSTSQTHSGLPQCDSRPVISAEPAYHNRVEYPPRSRVSNIQTGGNFSSVCHSPQHGSSPIHVSCSRDSSTGDRCLVTGLAGEVDVHVSTVPPAQQCHSEAQDHSDGRGDTHHPLVAFTTFANYQFEELESIEKTDRVDLQWHEISNIKVSGITKYPTLSKVMQGICVIPHSNADCERVFSIVRKNKTDFRSNMSVETLQALLIEKINSGIPCHKRKFSADFLKKAKKATAESLSQP